MKSPRKARVASHRKVRIASHRKVRIASHRKVRIGLGAATLPCSDARAYWRWVDRCEDSEVDSLWQTDRLVTRQRFLEPMSAMAALAGRTKRLKFGMNAVVVGLRDPLVLARECATIDFLSDGRLLPVFGVGGPAAPEWRATGRDPAGRGRRADEALEIMRRLWSEESVSFAGEHYRYRDATIAPRPVQQPLPLWIGGSSPAAIRRTARLGTGWLAGIQTPAQIEPVIGAIRAAAREAGRTIDEDHYGAGLPFRFGAPDDPVIRRAIEMRARAAGADFDPKAYFAVGGASDILERLAAYRDAGASKFVLIPIATDDADLMAQTERLIREVIPVAHAVAWAGDGA